MLGIDLGRVLDLMSLEPLLFYNGVRARAGFPSNLCLLCDSFLISCPLSQHLWKSREGLSTPGEGGQAASSAPGFLAGPGRRRVGGRGQVKIPAGASNGCCLGLDEAWARHRSQRAECARVSSSRQRTSAGDVWGRGPGSWSIIQLLQPKYVAHLVA